MKTGNDRSGSGFGMVTRHKIVQPIQRSLSSLLTGLGWRLMDASAHDMASRAFHRAARCAPGNALAWLGYGHSLKEAGRVQGAETAYRMARRRGFDRSECDFQIGLTAALRGDCAKTIRYYSLLRSSVKNVDALEGTLISHFPISDGVPAAPSAVLASQTRGAAPVPVLYDVSNLFAFTDRTVTGIQRVQLEMLQRAVDRVENPSQFVIFHPSGKTFVSIDPQTLFDLRNKVDATARERFAKKLEIVRDAASCATQRDARLVNFGLPADPDYYRAIARLRRDNGWKFVSFVHDCLPITNPEYFERSNIDNFERFFRLAAGTTDLFVTSTRSVRSTVLTVLERLSLSGPGVGVVPYGLADRTSERTVAGARADDNATVLARLGLADENYVLFVSTIEIRKNHRLALECWKRLAAEHGADAIPQLVFVGRVGWLVADLVEDLDRLDPAVTPVRRLSDIADEDLDVLYRHCRFTLFPSLAEGWGLPVTESLAWSKPVVASSLDVIREFGGDLVDYADPRSVDSFVHAAGRLIFDEPYRQSRITSIAQQFRRRSWKDVADDIDRLARSIPATAVTGLEPND